MKCSLPIKNTQNLVPTFYKIAISTKTKFFVTFCLFSLDCIESLALSIKIFKKIYLKMKSLKIFKCSQLQAKIGDPRR